jgi:photosystem II stability/assembly factor-like uncharacterized protein
VTGEAAFAASGTSITIAAPRTIAFATGGGSVSRLFRSVDDGRTWKVHDTPLPTGAGGAGIFSLAFRDGRHGIAVGGNYQAPDSARANVAMTKDGGVTWTLGDLKRTVPYVSAVVYAGNHAFATGPGGTFRSDDDGATWRRIGTTGFNAIGVTRDGLIFVGQDGAVGRLQLRR